MPPRRRRTKIARAAERIALGAVMGAVAFVLERRLLRAIRGRGESPHHRDRSDVDLSVASKDVDDQSGR